jgi:chitosanase
MITKEQEQNIKQIVNVAEMGVKNINYGDVYIYADSPQNQRQLTVSVGFTESGNLKNVVENYVAANGLYAKDFAKYVGRIGKTPYLVNDKELIKLFKLAGKDPIMRKTQEDLLRKKYWEPAYKWFVENGFTQPLSMLVIYDSWLHSGSVLDLLRKRFSEVPPIKGGNEKKWIESYVDARHQWLKYHSRKILNKTIYRTQSYKNEIAKGNWDLSGTEWMNGVPI